MAVVREFRPRTTVALLAIVTALLTASPRAGGAQEWRDMNPKQRYDALQNYWQYEREPEDRRHAVEERYERWRNLPPAEQDRVRQNYERWRRLPPGEKERIERKYEKWKRQSPAPP